MTEATTPRTSMDEALQTLRLMLDGADETNVVNIRGSAILRLRSALDALAAQPAAADGGWRPTHRHKKTGGEYVIVCDAMMQDSGPLDEEQVIVYRNKGGMTFVRPAYEFNDGRFEQIAPPASDTPAKSEDGAPKRTRQSDAETDECFWGGGNDYIACDTCGAEYAYAKGETRPKCPRAQPSRPDPADEGLLPCPFCGGTCNPKGWLSENTYGTLRSGPECNDCGATADSVDDWNRRATTPDTRRTPQGEGRGDALAVLKAYEQWEADLILSNEAWAPEGMAKLPTITQLLWDRLIEIQSLRNAVLSKPSRPDAAADDVERVARAMAENVVKQLGLEPTLVNDPTSSGKFKFYGVDLLSMARAAFAAIPTQDAVAALAANQCVDGRIGQHGDHVCGAVVAALAREREACLRPVEIRAKGYRERAAQRGEDDIRTPMLTACADALDKAAADIRARSTQQSEEKL